ncbi:hypothetical protein CPB84DRAFT_1392769 [Gymnopilus junonius]|uniref:Uncharacterized protein n=1 Tax=Gymnopilus junonius TaxID=109634 RepID=A0A9P5NLH4_GYMJU|nr:hypothetical protein CPB84DRAFT_1392769 [Gymnopilus junonius]
MGVPLGVDGDVDEDDDGMGGRLNAGVDGGGVISPYSYSPGPQQMQQNLAQSQPSMSQVGSGASGLGNEALLAGLGGAAAGAAGGALAGGYMNEKRRSYAGQSQPQLQERDYASGAGPSSYNYGNNSSNNPPLTPSDASYPNTGSGSSSAGYYPGLRTHTRLLSDAVPRLVRAR